MARTQLFVALCILALVAPSLQAGTIFADFITAVREDASFFGGISSNAVTVTGAEVGTLRSGFREGFSIESDGPIISNTGSVTINAAQLIDFTGHSETGSSTVTSAGTVSMAGSHLDVDAGTFTGSGNAGTVSSAGTLTFQGGEMTIGNGFGGILFNATENDLTFGAAQGLSLTADDGSIVFENGVAFASDIGGTSFTSVQGLSLLGNLIDVRSQNGATITTTGNQSYNAASIVELRSDDQILINGSGDLDVEASNNFIEIDAASAASFTASGDLDVTALNGAISIVNEGSSESVFEFNNSGEISFDADTTAMLATFGSGDLGLEADNSISLSSQTNIVFLIRETLDFSTDNQDVLFNAAGDVDFTSLQSNFTISGFDGVNFSSTDSEILISGENIYGTSQTGSVMATLGDITVDTDEFLFEQTDANEQNSGNFVMNINGDFDVVNNDEISFFSAGSTSFFAGSAGASTATVSAAGDLEIISTFGPNDITFTSASSDILITALEDIRGAATELSGFADQLTYDATDIDFEVSNVGKNTLQATSTIDADASNEIHLSADNTLSVLASGDVTFDSTLFLFAAHDSTFAANGDLIIDSAATLTIDAIISVSLEAETDIDLDDLALIDYSQTFTATGETISIDVTNTVAISADEVYFVSNFPSDRFALTANDRVEIFAFGGGTVASGGDLTFDGTFTTFVDDADLQAYDSIDIDADTSTLTVAENLDFISAGAVNIETTSDANYNFSEMTIAPAPDAGDLGDGVLLLQSEGSLTIDHGTYSDTALTGDILIDALAYSAVAEGDMSVLAENSWEFTADQDYLQVSVDDFILEAPLGASTDSVNYGVIANNDVAFSNIADTNINSDNFATTGTDSTTFTLDNFYVDAEDLDITSARDFIVDAQEDLNYLANSQLTFVAEGAITKTVAGDYNVRGDNSVTITDTVITYNGVNMVVNGVDFTTIESDEDVVNNVAGEGDIFADLIFIRAGGDITFEALDAAGIMTTAHDGEISFHQTGNFAVAATGATSDTGDVSFDATRNVRVEGELTFTSDGRFDIGLTDTNNPGVYVHTTSMDGNIVFDSVLGDFQASAGSTFSGEGLNGSFLLASQEGQSTSTASAINWTAGSDISFTATEDIQYALASDFSATLGGNGARSNFESLGEMAFVARGTSAGVATTVTNIDVGGDMTMSTGQQGALDISSTADVAVTTLRDSAFVSTNDFVVNSGEFFFNSNAGDIDIYTTGGAIEFDAGDNFSSTSSRDTTVTSGRDTVFEADTLQSITTGDFLFHSVNGATIIDGEDATFTATATITLDSQGARTDPRDGVIMTVEDTLSVVSTAGEIVLNAFDQVIIGEQTRPDVTLELGGTAAVPGFVSVSDGATRFNANEDIVWEPEGNVDITTTEELVVVSDGVIEIIAAGAGASTDLRVQATNGNVHFHADVDTTMEATTTTLTSTTGNFKITGKSRLLGSSLTFDGDVDIESRSFLSNSGLLQSTSDASDLTFDGISGFTIASAVGSVGTIELGAEGDILVTATSDFEIRSIDQDGGISVEATTDISIDTITSGDIIFDASSNNSQGLLQISGDTLDITSLNSFSITSNNPAHDDLRNGDIYFFCLDGPAAISANDQIEFETGENFEVYISSDFVMTAGQSASFISSEDMIFHAQGGGFQFAAAEDFEIQNSPESEGDLILHTGSEGDSISILVGDDILLVTGADWIGQSLGDITLLASGVDSVDGFSVRIQTEGEGGDIDFISNDSIDTTAVEIHMTTLTGDVRFGAARSLLLEGTATADFITSDVNNGGGDIVLDSQLADLRITADGVFGVYSLAEDNQAGTMTIEANGIGTSSEAAISFAALDDFGSIVVASTGTDDTEGNTVSFVAEQSFNLRMNGVFAYFGALSEDFVDSFNGGAGGYGYHRPLFGSEPLEQTTSIEAHGLDADILFSSRAGRDSYGELHIVTGLVDRLGFELENYYSDARDAQLTVVADGGSDALIRFDVESGIIFRGVSSPVNYYISNQNSNYYPSYIPESDANFVTTDPNADIVIKTDVNAQQARVVVEAHDVLFQSQDRSWYGTTGDYGSAVTMLVRDGDASFTTRNNVNTDASPGIAINAYDSSIFISSTFDGSVNFEAVRNLNVRANGGYLVDATTVEIEGGNVAVRTATGDINFNTIVTQVNVQEILTFTTRDPQTPSTRDAVGGDIVFRANNGMSISSDSNTGEVRVSSEQGGNILVHFGSFLRLEGDTTVFGSMTFPMTQEEIRPGTFCNNRFQDNSVVIVKQPLFVNNRNFDLYSKFGISMCICNRATSQYACMNLEEFFY